MNILIMKSCKINSIFIIEKQVLVLGSFDQNFQSRITGLQVFKIFANMKFGLPKIIPLIICNLVQFKMNTGNIVFATYNSQLWPGKIVSLGMMAEIQFFKVKSTYKVPINSLHQFTNDIAQLLLSQNSDKSFAAAIKMAQKELNQRGKSCSEEKRTKKENIKSEKIKLEKLEHLEAEKQRKAIGNEAFKKEEEDEKGYEKEPIMASSAADFVFHMNQLELIKQVKENKPKQIQFQNTSTKEVEKFVREPRFLLKMLTEQLMRELWFQNNKSTTLPIEKRIKNILSCWEIDIKTILKSDICLIINLTIRDKEKMPWITPSYFQVIQKFKEKMAEKLSQYLDDYSEVGVLLNRVANLQLKVSY